MMFSSNQVLQFSGSLSHRNELRHALQFAIEASGWMEPMTRANNPCKCVYQIAPDGRYCIGWGGERDGWQEYPFDFDLDIISQIIVQHMSKLSVKHGGGDGSYSTGFLMKALPGSTDDRRMVVNPHYGIVVFEPYSCYYAK